MSTKQRCHMPQETWLIDPCTFPTELRYTTSKCQSTNFQKIALKVDKHLFGIPGQGHGIQKDKPEESAYSTDKLEVPVEKKWDQDVPLTILFKANPRKNCYGLNH